MNQPNSQPTSDLMLRETASQTAGPYVHIGLALAAAGNPVRDEEIWNEMAKPDAEGEHIEVVKPFNSFGRTATTFDHGSEWSLTTIKPGAVKHPSGQLMAPHINLTLFARGVNIHLQTRLYFDDEADANAQCPVLSRIESPARRQTRRLL